MWVLLMSEICDWPLSISKHNLVTSSSNMCQNFWKKTVGISFGLGALVGVHTFDCRHNFFFGVTCSEGNIHFFCHSRPNSFQDLCSVLSSFWLKKSFKEIYGNVYYVSLFFTPSSILIFQSLNQVPFFHLKSLIMEIWCVLIPIS